MRTRTRAVVTLLSLALLASHTVAADQPDDDRFQPLDVFQLEYASDPQISPDGKRIVYVRNFMDIMKDRRRSNLWIINADGSEHRPVTTGKHNDSSPRWSPDIGGLDLGRLYAGGSSSVAKDGTVAFTMSRPEHRGCRGRSPYEVGNTFTSDSPGRQSGRRTLLW